MGSLLAALATILLTGLAALLAVPYFVDWNEYRTQFELQAARLVGRPVVIEGDIDMTILPVPRLSLRGVRIADEFGKFERPFAEVEQLNAILSLPPLLSGTMEAKSIDLDQPIVRLKIDEFGEGTWLSIGPYGLNIPVPVREVVLNKVDITDGAIELRKAHQSPAARFDRISGTFSADSLTGPFRFVGVGAIGGGDKEIQLSAAKSREGPSLRVKGALRSLDGVSLYQLDGEIKGLDGPVHYVGPVAARLALDTKAKQAETGQIAERMPGRAIEMRASANITLEDAALDDITLTLTQNDWPQSVTGSAHASWTDVPRLDLSIEASWLDIDQMLKMGSNVERPVPTTAIAALPRVFEGWSFKPRQGRIKAKIQQAGLGGDVVEKVDFVASHNREGWQIETLVARLPGDTDIDVRGTLPAGEALAFNGDFTLKGKNLSRLLRWSAPSLGVVDAGNVTDFSLSSGVTLTPEQLAFRNAKGSLGDSSFTGDLVHDYGKESRLLLALESERLDLRPLYGGRGATSPAKTGEDDLAALAASAKGNNWAAETVPARKTTLADVLKTVFKAEQSNVSLQISELRLPDFEARDVRSAFRYEKGTFDFRELNVATTDGLKVQASGRITGFETKPDGSLKLSVDAPSAQSVTNLARLIGLDSVGRGARRRIEALSPFQLSGRLDAVSGDSLVKLTMAGHAGGSELSVSGQLRGGLDALGDASVDVNGVIGNADGRRLIAQLAPEVPADKATSQKGDGFLKVSAVGKIKSGLASKIKLQTAQARGQFEGQIALLDKPSWSMAGELNMRASQAATALSMLRLSPGGEPVTGAADVRASISKKGARYQVSDLTLKIGGETVQGAAEINVAAERPVAKIDIKAASVALPKIAAYLVDWERRDVTSEIANVASGAPAVWRSEAFSLASLRAVDGTFSIKAPAIVVADGLSLADGQLAASLQSGTLSITKLEGKAFGGSVSGSARLKALKGHAAFSGTLKAGNIDLAAVARAQGGNEVVSGTADLDLSVEGEGLSPRGLISVLNGKGQVVLSKGSFNGLSPSVLGKAASRYLNEEIPDKEHLAGQLDGAFRQGRLPYRSITAPVTVKDGILQVAQVEFGGKQHRADAELTVDLASFRFDSEWRIGHEGKTDDGEALPPVRLVFAGPLSGFSAVKPQLYADQFERFLTIKRMDQDMERLEKLSKERGKPTSSAVPHGPRPEAGTRASRDGSAEAGSSGATVPTQSLLRAPPIDRKARGEPEPAAQEQAAQPTAAGNKRGAAKSGWATGTETTGEPPSNGWKTAPQPLPQGAQDFEAQIREVLRSQGEQQPSYRR